MALDIHSNPELGFEEFRASSRQVELFNEWVFNVTFPFVGPDTAYKAEFGSGKLIFCLCRSMMRYLSLVMLAAIILFLLHIL